MIVMPFSRSRSMESMMRSGTASLARNRPDCQSMASTSVVLPWSTWAMIATFRMLSRCCISPLYHVVVRCPRCGSPSVRRSSRVGAYERIISAFYLYPFRCQRCAHRFRALRWARYPHPAGERRDFDRMAVHVPARLTAGTESADAETTDLSITGCAVRTSARFPPGTEVSVMLQLGAQQTVFIAEAIVRAAHEGRVSLQFVHVAIEEQLRLAEYINAIALPIDVGRPPRARFPMEVVLVAVAGLLVIFLILSMVSRIGTPVR